MISQFSPFTFGSAAGLNSLPIELIDFTAILRNKSILLNWSTASEENFDYFLIERSADGVAYEPLAEVKGAGWSREILSYSYTDPFPLNGKSYYRLKAVDLDATFEYSQAVMVQVEGNDVLRVSTNPIQNDQVNFQLGITPEERIFVNITDVSGVEIFSGSFDAGFLKYSIEKSLDRGMYLLKVSTGEKAYTARFMKQ